MHLLAKNLPDGMSLLQEIHEPAGLRRRMFRASWKQGTPPASS